MKQLIQVIIFLNILILPVFAAEPADKDKHFLVLSDIHFSPFVICKKEPGKPCSLINKLQQAPASAWASILATEDRSTPAYHQETNYSLLISALDAAKKTANEKHAGFVLVLGDFLAHDYKRSYRTYSQDRSRIGYETFVRKTLEFLTSELHDTFPNLNVYMAVGNNDSYHNDYFSASHGKFYNETGRMWSQLLLNKNDRIAMQKEFANSGYYSLVVPNQPDLRIVMLNSVLFSYKVRGKNTDEAANAELAWLHNELVSAAANHQKVLIGMHVPTGIDVYASLKIRLFTMVEFWQQKYLEKFQVELKQFAPTIFGIFAGHLHADWFQVVNIDNGNQIPETGTPSISPIFGNNPGYKIYSYTDDPLQLKNFMTYYYSIDNKHMWQSEYNFNHIFQPNCESCPLIKGMETLRPRGLLASFYKQYYAVNTNSQPITTQWDPYYWCAIHELNATSYKTCTG